MKEKILFINGHLNTGGVEKSLLDIVSVLMMLLMIAGRMLSGCHWATDIIGGVLYAAAIVALYRDLSKPVR